ncbi:MAG TPA: YEATS-associated helix-containing protein, partial [Bacteroidota bacterium]|nr:YEATS-associated helix-containing protein [Bacteroidota bacterium]
AGREGHSLLRSVCIGIAAALLVPLFLNMISSTLLVQTEVDEEKLFVFAGFCLIAAISSSAFIRRLSRKVLQDVQDLQKSIAKTQADLDLLLEVNSEPVHMGPAVAHLEKNVSKVLKSLTAGRYSFRSAEGISHDAALSSDEITVALDQLASAGLARQLDRPEDARWVATPRGRGVVDQGVLH